LKEKNIEGYFNRWRLLWIGIPGRWYDHFVSSDLSAVWRRHLIWSKPAGRSLREALTQRFASTTVFLSLILGTEIRTLFSPSTPANDVRLALKAREYSLEYFAGVALCLSIFFSIAALIANFTSWGIYTVVGDENLKLIARSSIGLYGAQLPNRLVVLVIYSFYLWVALFWWIIMPTYTASILSCGGVVLIVHIVSTYSAIAQIIMSTGAMSSYRVMDRTYEEEKLPRQLAEELLRRTLEARANETPVSAQYKEINRASVMTGGHTATSFGSAGNGLHVEDMDVDLAD